MSQWGKILTISGCRFLPNVVSAPFENIQGDHEIDSILLVDIGTTDMEQARSTLSEVRDRFVGKSYSEWLKESSS